jgi:nitrite reductase/ring-hydroxylating ferredoxin subunit
MTWKAIAVVTDVPPGEVKSYRVDDVPVALYNLDGEFFATHNICTHALACLSDGYLENGQIECPLHQGVFDIRTGKAVSGPVDVDVQVFPVKLDGADVLIDTGK